MHISTPSAIEHLPTDSLTPYARNARTHSDEQVAQIAASIQEFGFTNPVLIDDTGCIIAGHGRVMAASKIGMQTVPCIRLGHLDEVQRRRYILADNRLAELSHWDEATVAAELQDLSLDGVDFASMGFDDESLTAIIGQPSASHGHESERDDDESEPTADDYADKGAGIASGADGKSILYPLLIQLPKAQWRRWRSLRGQQSDLQAFIAMLDRVSPEENTP